MKITEIKGDVLKVKADLICHQVNCLGIMGNGLAKQVREQYPNVYEDYKFLCEHTRDRHNLLGDVQFLYLNTDADIANVFGQYAISDIERQTDYNALKKAFKKIHAYIESVQGAGVFQMYNVAIPKYFGCGLGKGDWDTVFEIITTTLGDLDINLMIVEYEK